MTTPTTAASEVQRSPAEPRPVLEVRDLRVHYATPLGDVIAVNGVSFDVQRGEILGLVGESGCGKSTVAMATLRLVQPPGRIVSGQVLLNGTNVLELNERQLSQVRWRDIALIPQGAMNSLNPVMRVKDQIGDAIETHEGKQPSKVLRERILDILGTVGLHSRVNELFPHELSGGMKQRVCIAMAIALNPSLIIADEPTSALDVVVQRVVAQTLLDVKKRLNVSMILIGHDMGLQAQLVDRIAVMYAGNIAEITPVDAAFNAALHPYTQLLIASIPSIKERKPLNVTEGLTHDLRRPPPGCVFHLRCPHVADECRIQVPLLREMRPNQKVACHRCELWM
jgi:oligopeptide/dipeptide ABC transporter ATP-binding protein